MNFKGTLPTLILEALVHEPTHGYRIAQTIKERSAGILDFKEGTLYPALHKLETEGMVESFDAVEKGRTRRNYRITDGGREMLARNSSEWRAVSRAATMILGESINKMTRLDSWLNETTRHLARDSAAQVRSEIQEHYESAIDAAIAAGSTIDEADRLALDALGDAKTANCQYRQVPTDSLGSENPPRGSLGIGRRLLPPLAEASHTGSTRGLQLQQPLSSSLPANSQSPARSSYFHSE